jgi:hypothetical protein
MTKHNRISDYIFTALKMALEQKDLQTAELLTRALENTISKGLENTAIEERRNFSDQFEAAMTELQALRKAQKIT